MTHTIMQPRDIRVGGGAIDQIGSLAASLGVSRPLIVTDGFMVSTGVPDRVMASMLHAGLQPSLFSGTVPDPTTDSLGSGLAALHDGSCDAVVGLGGGSAMDTAKALALLGVQGGDMVRYKSPASNTGPALPIIAVPTTAGSGSEATQFTVITDTRSDEKMLCAGPAFLPVAAVIDYELTLSMPPRLTADTGVDALTHAVEAYVSKKANPFSDALCLAAITTIGKNLRRAYTDGQDRPAREAMMLASTQAGIAFSNSSVALVHGMSRPLGGHFHIAHGLSNAMLFPAVTEYSSQYATTRYAHCAQAFGVAGPETNYGLAVAAFVEGLKTLSEDLAVPTPATYGIAEAEWQQRIPVMAEQALASGSPNNNPRVPSVEDIAELYMTVYK